MCWASCESDVVVGEDGAPKKSMTDIRCAVCAFGYASANWYTVIQHHSRLIGSVEVTAAVSHLLHEVY